MELIGQIIKKNRISKKLTLDQVAFELKISKETIKKIENNEFDESINKVFYYGHIRSISELLNLNPKETVERFKLENSIGTEVKSNYIQKPLNQYSFLHLGRFFSFASIVLIFSLFYFLFISESKKSEYAIIPDLPENYEPIIEKALVDMEINNNQVNKQSEEDTNNLITSTTVLASDKVQDEVINDKIITLKFINPTWIQIRDIDDKIILSQLMSEKEEYSYQVKNKYSLTAGNAGNILVSIDNNIVGKLGNFGQVIDSVIIDSDFKN